MLQLLKTKKAFANFPRSFWCFPTKFQRLKKIVLSSSVRRILNRGGQKFQKIWEEQRSESEVVPLKFSLIFRPNLGEEQKKKKKKVFTQGPSRFSPELTQISSQKPESLMPNLQRGGGHASILLTLLCNFAILATQRGGAMAQWSPPKYAPGAVLEPRTGQFSRT